MNNYDLYAIATKLNYYTASNLKQVYNDLLLTINKSHLGLVITSTYHA